MHIKLWVNNDKFRPLLIFLLGTIISLLYSFIIYPLIQHNYQVVLEPDSYGLLGRNLWRGYGLTYNPELGPTVYRGPIYPAFIASLLLLTSGAYPYAIWIAQSILNGITCLLVYYISDRCWNKKVAIFSGLGCAIHPMLFFYSPRMLNEILLAFLLVSLIYITISFLGECSSTLSAIVIGVLLALLCLTKGTFLPLIIILPLTIILSSSWIEYKKILIIPSVAVLVILPWTIRNYLLVGNLVPVHTGMGFNLKIGNAFANDFMKYPLSYSKIWDNNFSKIVSLYGSPTQLIDKNEIAAEYFYKDSAMKDMEANLSLLPKKLFSSGLMFWLIGETPSKTMLLIIFRLPIIILAFLAMYNLIYYKVSKLYPAMVICIFYWIAHLPFAPPARLSTPIMPIMFAMAISYLFYSYPNIPSKKV